VTTSGFGFYVTLSNTTLESTKITSAILQEVSEVTPHRDLQFYDHGLEMEGLDRSQLLKPDGIAVSEGLGVLMRATKHHAQASFSRLLTYCCLHWFGRDRKNTQKCRTKENRDFSTTAR
jgi:hypothetical protein